MTEREEEVLVQELAMLAANKPLVYDRHFYMPVPQHLHHKTQLSKTGPFCFCNFCHPKCLV